LLNDHLRDCQAKTHPTSVDVPCLCEAAEEPEELIQIILLDPETGILDITREPAVIKFDLYSNVASVGKLDRVAHQVEEDLLEPLLVRVDGLRDTFFDIELQI
jgi:hypothetical protein